MKKIILLILLSCTLEYMLARDEPIYSMQRYALHFRQEANNIRLWMNGNGVMGEQAVMSERPDYDTIGLEYPVKAPLYNEHLLCAAPWFGAIRSTVNGRQKVVDAAVGYTLVQLPLGDVIGQWNTDFFGSRPQGDTVYYSSILIQNFPNRRGFDDDRDGMIDEDPLDGLDNDGDWLDIRDDLNKNDRPDPGEPNVDEDYGAISESDYYIAYRDSFSEYDAYNHIPLGIKVWQKSYAWKSLVREPIIFVEYHFINQSFSVLDSVYLGLYVRPWVGPYDERDNQGRDTGHVGLKQFTKYIPQLRTVYFDNLRSTPSTPFGITLLGASQPLDELRFTYKWWKELYLMPPSHEEKYDAMASGTIQTEGDPFRDTSEAHVLFSIGPFLRLKRGDTISFAIALHAGEGIESGRNNLRGNVLRAMDIYNNNWRLNYPPSPPLNILAGEQRVTLNWKWYNGFLRSNPLEIWDDLNHYVNSLPDTHWRRRNPPAGKIKGGRIFEGFRIWRSDFPAFELQSFSLLHQFDVADDLNIGPQTGLQFSYVDSNITRGKRYWYAVTSYSLPDYFITDDGDTLIIPGLESPLYDNVLTYQVPFSPSYELGKVKVVPNPYRTDMDYTYEGGGWEGLGRQWVEDKRIVWFIHLPAKCTIRIFTIAGEVVKVISHDDAQREANGLPIGQEEFLLLSESNRALASGIYVYLVESEYGVQTGKFVVIR